jgi:hypothetical protein
MTRRRALMFLVAFLHPVQVAAQDTLIVVADNPPVWGAAPQLVEELRIGVLDGDARYQFGSVENVVEVSDAEVWVADETLGVIRRYSLTGVHLGDVGRKGQGPGEFKSMDGMRLLPDGRVALLDISNGRIHLFDEAGHLTGDYRSPNIGLHIFPQPLEVDTAGRLYVKDADRSSLGPNLPFLAYWIRLSSSGEILDTVPAARITREGSTVPYSLISPLGYLLQGRNDEYALHWPLRDGRTVRIERSWTPVPYDSDERKELQARYDAVFGPGEREVPQFKHPWSIFRVDGDGRIWIERNAAAERIPEAEREERRQNPGLPGMPAGPFPPITWRQPAVYDVIEPTGRFLGSVTVPRGFRANFNSDAPELAFAQGTTLWTIEKGQFDEEYVVRYRITSSP